MAWITVSLQIGHADSPLAQIRFAQSKQNILWPHGTKAALTSLSPQTMHSRCCEPFTLFEPPHKMVPTPFILPFIEFTTPFILFKPTNWLILMPFGCIPLFLQLNEASNESVGLTDAVGDEVDPNDCPGVGIDQIFGWKKKLPKMRFSLASSFVNSFFSRYFCNTKKKQNNCFATNLWRVT